MVRVLIFLVFTVVFGNGEVLGQNRADPSFVKARGIRFMLNDKEFFVHGFNAYWMMCLASNQSTRYLVTEAFYEASNIGLNVARTWAFSDGYNNSQPLQTLPGTYNTAAFEGLDFVISEAKNYGVKLILSLVNNYEAYGGKKQYVEWAKLVPNSDDAFFKNHAVKKIYKNNVEVVLNRNNSLTGVCYKDDPTIMAWELMNEPRCTSDPSGETIRNWVQEMSGYVKTIDKNHLVEAGLEGFYTDSTKFGVNVSVGTDFIADNQNSSVDFATIHMYPAIWLSNPSNEQQITFVNEWLGTHFDDATYKVKKPLLLAEFGKSYKDPGDSVQQRDKLFNIVYEKIRSAIKQKKAIAGSLFWQLLSNNMDNYQDGFGIILSDNTSATVKIIHDQSKWVHPH